MHHATIVGLSQAHVSQSVLSGYHISHAMDLHRLSFKNRWSSRRHTAVTSPPPSVPAPAPTPFVRLDMNRSRTYKQLQSEDLPTVPNCYKPGDIPRTNHSPPDQVTDILPASPSFDSDDDEVNGEPLLSVYDFAHSLPKQTRVLRTKRSNSMKGEIITPEVRNGKGQAREEEITRRPKSPVKMTSSRES